MEKTSIEGSAGGCQTCFIADASKGKRGRMISMYLDKTYMEVLRCTGEWQRLGKKNTICRPPKRFPLFSPEMLNLDNRVLQELSGKYRRQVASTV